MPLFPNIFKKKTAGETPVKQQVTGPYLTETVVFGMHQYRTRDEDSSVFFVDEDRKIRKMLVDSMGKIKNFPGIEDKESIQSHIEEGSLEPQIRFRTSFRTRQDGWIMLWQVQPDGRYWADEDGFGMTNDEEIILYTFVDLNGDFTDPFKLYSIGTTQYYKEIE